MQGSPQHSSSQPTCVTSWLIGLQLLPHWHDTTPSHTMEHSPVFSGTWSYKWKLQVWVARGRYVRQAIIRGADWWQKLFK